MRIRYLADLDVLSNEYADWAYYCIMRMTIDQGRFGGLESREM